MSSINDDSLSFNQMEVDADSSNNNADNINFFIDEDEENPNHNLNLSIISVEKDFSLLKHDYNKNNYYNNYNDVSYVNQNFPKPINNIKTNHFFFNNKRRPRTSLDILKINSIEYKRFLMNLKIKKMLKELNLSKSLEDEVCHLCFLFTNKLLIRKKLTTIVPVILYKILKKYNNKTYSLKDLKQKINFKYKTYFKNEKLFPIFDHNQILLKNNLKNAISNEQYINSLKIDLSKCFQKLKNTYLTQKQKYGINGFRSNCSCNYNKGISLLKNKRRRIENIGNENLKFNLNTLQKKEFRLIIRMSDKLIINEKIVEKVFIEPVIEELENCKESCNQFINENNTIIQLCPDKQEREVEDQTATINNNYKFSNQSKSTYSSNNNSANISFNFGKIDKIEKNIGQVNFAEFFKEKIDTYSLAISLIKYLSDSFHQIKISYKVIQECFDIGMIKIINGKNLIKSFINYRSRQK